MSELKISIVHPHKVVSRLVEEKDIDRVYEDSKEIYKIFGRRVGLYNTFLAIAHPQITKKEPLRFFVINPSLKITEDFPEAVIINPEIIRHTNNTVDSEEGCLSFPTIPPTIVQRWNKCEVRFKVLTPDRKISDWFTMNLSGMMAKVFQHEADHLDSKYIYLIK